MKSKNNNIIFYDVFGMCIVITKIIGYQKKLLI